MFSHDSTCDLTLTLTTRLYYKKIILTTYNPSTHSPNPRLISCWIYTMGHIRSDPIRSRIVPYKQIR